MLHVRCRSAKCKVSTVERVRFALSFANETFLFHPAIRSAFPTASWATIHACGVIKSERSILLLWKGINKLKKQKKFVHPKWMKTTTREVKKSCCSRWHFTIGNSFELEEFHYWHTLGSTRQSTMLRNGENYSLEAGISASWGRWTTLSPTPISRTAWGQSWCWCNTGGRRCWAGGRQRRWWTGGSSSHSRWRQPWECSSAWSALSAKGGRKNNLNFHSSTSLSLPKSFSSKGISLWALSARRQP